MRTLYGVDEPGGWIYFAGTERSHVGGDVYRIKLDGVGPDPALAGARHALGELQPGIQQVRRYVERRRHADADPPAQGRRQRAARHRREQGGGARRLPPLQAGVRAGEDARRLRDGGDADQAAGLRPGSASTRSTSRPTPGPHAPQVRNAWGGTATCTTSSSRSRASSSGSATTAARAARAPSRRGPRTSGWARRELADIEDGLAWLKQQPWVDARASASTAGATAASW